jgi:uncharacterized protein
VEFYTDYGVALQKRFFGHFLKGEDTGWAGQPAVQLQVRRVDGSFVRREADQWPLAEARWTRLYLDVASGRLAPAVPVAAASLVFDAPGAGLEFWTDPLPREMELTGPAAARLVIASSTTDADLFLTLRVQDRAGRDITFASGQDPNGCVGYGWLRASHRATDPVRSQPWRPWHAHDRPLPLTPGEPAELDVEIWPTSVLIPAGYRFGISVQGRDFEWPGDGPWPLAFGVPMRGHGVFLHDEPADRPPWSGDKRPSYLLLPVVSGSFASPD